MKRLIVVTFGILGLIFFEMSGGADFDPDATRLSRIEPPAAIGEEKLETVMTEPDQPETETESVTRVTLNLSSVDSVLRGRDASDAGTAVLAPAPEDTAAPVEEKPEVVFTGLLGNQTSFPTLDRSTSDLQSVNVNTETGAGVDDGTGVRQVTGNRVNLRGGPGTEFSVVESLTRGAKVEVLQDPGNGWVELRVIGGDTIGWMADFLLSDG